MPTRNYFAEVEARRLARSREHAELAIETAFRICELGPPSDQQLADLADAVDAYRARQFAIAVDLAEAAFEQKRGGLQKAMRPSGMSLTLLEVKALFASLRVT